MTKSQSSSKDKSTTHARGRGRSRPAATSNSSGCENFIVDEATRRAMIAEAAYYRAEQRGFAPGFEMDDWLASESELDARCIESRSTVRSAVGSKEMH